MEINPIQDINVPKPDKNPNEDVQSIHTYKSDVAEFIKREGKTLADIAIAENARRSDTLKEEGSSPDKRKRALYIIGATLALIGISVLIFWTVLRPKQEIVVTATGEVAPSMFVTGIKQKPVSVENQNQSRTLSTIDIALKESSPFLVLQLTSGKDATGATLLTSRDFFDKAGIYPPGDLIRSLTDNFALGSIGGKSRFLVLKNNYYGGAFAGMLGWENNIINDLRDLLDLPAIKSSNITTTTVGTTTVLSQIISPQFKDGVVANRDARIFRDGSGSIILLYLFPDNDTIVITGSESATKIVVEKLLRTKTR